MRVPLAAAEAAAVARLAAAGAAPAVAASVGAALVEAEAEGNVVCGLHYLPVFEGQLRAGRVDGRAVPVVERTRPGAVRIDARGGFAQPALDRAVEALAEAAPATGVAVAAIRGSYNALALGRPARRLAEAGLVALVTSNAPGSVAAPGHRGKVFGTNPLAFAAPVPGGAPLVIDQGAGAVTRTEVTMRAARGQALEPGWGQDEAGAATTDAAAALRGALLPAGGRKGANLALMVEVLAAALSGATLSARAEMFAAEDRPHPGVGHTLIALDPAALGGLGGIADLAGVLAADGQRLPGARRAAALARARAEGLALTGAQRAALGLG